MLVAIVALGALAANYVDATFRYLNGEEVYITEDGQIHFGSRTRWITAEDDNCGFARWGMEHREELLRLGEGRHFGEWWGAGIQRKYGVADKRFRVR